MMQLKTPPAALALDAEGNCSTVFRWAASRLLRDGIDPDTIAALFLIEATIFATGRAGPEQARAFLNELSSERALCYAAKLAREVAAVIPAYNPATEAAKIARLLSDWTAPLGTA